MEQFEKGDLVLYKWSREACVRQMFYLVTCGNRLAHGTEFIQVRRATKDGKFDRRFSNYSHTGLAKNYVLVKRAEEISALPRTKKASGGQAMIRKCKAEKVEWKPNRKF